MPISRLPRYIKGSAICLILLLGTFSLSAESGSTTLIIGKKPSSKESIHETLRKLGLSSSKEVPQLNIVCVEVPNSSADSIVRQLQSYDSVEYVEKDATVPGNF